MTLRVLTAAGLAVPLTVATAGAGASIPPPDILVASATWASSDDRGESSCTQTGTGQVTCRHGVFPLLPYVSRDYTRNAETCTMAATTVLVPVPGNCQATFSGRSSGSGLVVGESGYAPACATVGVMTGTFIIDSPIGSYQVTVTIHAHHALGVFAGTQQVVSGTNILVEHAQGHFTWPCGKPHPTIPSTFYGTWSLTSS
jgi:hypothetical protein